MRLFLTPIFMIIFFSGFLIFGYMHEQVHVAIFKHYGIDSEVYYFKYFPDFVTIPESDCPTEACITSNLMNYAISYPLTAFYILIGLGMLILIALTEMKQERQVS